MIRRPPRSTLFPTRRSSDLPVHPLAGGDHGVMQQLEMGQRKAALGRLRPDRKSTRLNSSHGYISYAVFCLKKKKKTACIESIPSDETIETAATDRSTTLACC